MHSARSILGINVGLVLSATICIASGCNRAQDVGPTAVSLDFYVVLDSDQCAGGGCKEVELSSSGGTVLMIGAEADVVVEAREIELIEAVELSGVDPDRRRAPVWTGRARFNQDAAARLRALRAALAREDPVLVLVGDKVLDVTYPRLLARYMGFGAFASREELVRVLSPLGEVRDAGTGAVRVFSEEELDALKATDRLLEESRRIREDLEKKGSP